MNVKIIRELSPEVQAANDAIKDYILGLPLEEQHVGWITLNRILKVVPKRKRGKLAVMERAITERLLWLCASRLRAEDIQHSAIEKMTHGN